VTPFEDDDGDDDRRAADETDDRGDRDRVRSTRSTRRHRSIVSIVVIASITRRHHPSSIVRASMRSVEPVAGIDRSSSSIVLVSRASNDGRRTQDHATMSSSPVVHPSSPPSSPPRTSSTAIAHVVDRFAPERERSSVASRYIAVEVSTTRAIEGRFGGVCGRCGVLSVEWDVVCVS
jgi:hypothetical protein